MLPTMRALGVLLGSVLALCGNGCGSTSRPVTAAQADAPNPATSSPPLAARRLSNTEYVNTLRGLFPEVSATVAETRGETSRGFSNQQIALLASPLLVERYHDNALNIARSAEHVLTRDYPCDTSTKEPGACAHEFIRQFGRRAFRRPLSDSEVALYAQSFERPGIAGNYQLGQQLVIAAILQSPSFLYRFDEVSPRDPGAPLPVSEQFGLVSRLSYFIWATAPDDSLLDMAESNALATPQDVRALVGRMLEDPRARQGMMVLLSEWLQLSKLDRTRKPPGHHWDEGLKDEVSRSAQEFLGALLTDPEATSTQLLTSRTYWTGPRLATVLGVDAPRENPSTVEAGAARAGGWLTHPAFLASHAYGKYPSPVLRGVFIMDRLLCKPPSPPPQNFQIPIPENEPTPRTNRELYTRATRGAGCGGCHSKINPLGFALEHFDEIGRYRTEDAGLPVNSRGRAMGFRFEDAADLTTQIANSDQYQRCVTEMWLRYAMGRPLEANETGLVADVESDFRAQGYRLRKLVEAIAVRTTFSGN